VSQIGIGISSGSNVGQIGYVYNATSSAQKLQFGFAGNNGAFQVVNTSGNGNIVASVNGQFSAGVLRSSTSTGTAPLIIASTTNVANLNASSLNGATFASPGSIGSGAASTGAFTSISASGKNVLFFLI